MSTIPHILHGKIESSHMKSSVELLTRNGEKNLLRGMFRDSDDESVISLYSNDDTSELNPILNNMNDGDDEVGISEDYCLQSYSTSDLICYASRNFDILINLSQNARKGIAFQLWPAANFLCDYIDENYESIIRSCLNQIKLKPITDSSVLETPLKMSSTFRSHNALTIIELGAGIGLCGIYMSKLLSIVGKSFGIESSQVLLTDIPEAIPLLESNIDNNKISSSFDISVVSKAKVLHWGNYDDFNNILTECCEQSTIPPLIIASDCVYWECLFEPFADTLYSFVSQGSIVLLSHVKRWKKDSKFFRLCKKKGMNVETVFDRVDEIVNENTLQSNRRVTRVYRITLLSS